MVIGIVAEDLRSDIRALGEGQLEILRLTADSRVLTGGSPASAHAPRQEQYGRCPHIERGEGVSGRRDGALEDRDPGRVL